MEKGELQSWSQQLVVNSTRKPKQESNNKGFIPIAEKNNLQKKHTFKVEELGPTRYGVKREKWNIREMGDNWQKAMENSQFSNIITVIGEGKSTHTHIKIIG